MSAGTGLPDFDGAQWRQNPVVHDVICLPDVGVLRQGFDATTPAYEVAVPPMANHVLLWVLRHGSGRYETRLDGRLDPAPGRRPRNAYLLPAGVGSFWRGPAVGYQSLHFHFAPGWLQRVADETGVSNAGAELPLLAGLHDPSLDALGRALLAATRTGEGMTAAYAEHWSVLAALRLLRMPMPSVRLSIAPWRLARTLALAEARLHEDVSLSDLAEAAGLSRFHFARAFRAATGETPHAYLRRLRCERAKALMMEGGMSLAEIALACGFAHQAHFTTAFRRVTGTTPGRWREECLS